jgi:GGDEF domain-containing protein
VVVPDTPANIMPALIDRLSAAVKAAGVEVLKFECVTLAVGEARLGTDGEQPEELLAAADKRMYAAKTEMKKLRAGSTDLANLMSNVAAAEIHRRAAGPTIEGPAPVPRVKITHPPAA